jgi:hypothetical protein
MNAGEAREKLYRLLDETVAIMSRFSSLGRAQTLFSSERRTGTLYRKPSTSFQSPACVNPSSRDLLRR